MTGSEDKHWKDLHARQHDICYNVPVTSPVGTPPGLFFSFMVRCLHFTNQDAFYAVHQSKRTRTRRRYLP